MAPPQPSPSTKDVDSRRLKREDVLHRSLRECTTRRLAHFNPCVAKHEPRGPTLTSYVQWTTGRLQAYDDTAGHEEFAMDDIDDEEHQSNLSSPQSEIDELLPSDDDRSPPNSRPSTGVSAGSGTLHAVRKTISARDDAQSTRSCSDSSDTEKRQPSFPGNRDIIDSHFPSPSLSPPTQISFELQTPSPVSEVPNGWKSPHSTGASSALELHLHPNAKPPTKDDRLFRVDSWRVDFHESGHVRQSSAYERYAHASSFQNLSRNYHPGYSPSMSASSTPPSPPPVLPPIQHLNATLPVNTGSTPGVMHWRFRERLEPHPHAPKRVSPSYHSSTDEYDDGHSSAASPRSLPPLLPHIKMIEQGYSAARSLPVKMPMSVVPPVPPATNPTRNKNAWKEYAQLVSGPNEQTEFRCVWRVGFSGDVTDHCGYTAKRHLVKRHIETRHLQFKDHICPYCGKAFPQRVSLMIHVNRHTGAKPHPCRYVDCDKTFSDPARRHKHMVEAHGYNPQGPRKRHRTVDSYHANANFETNGPWTITTKGSGSEGKR